jgi:hypothetical protein
VQRNKWQSETQQVGQIGPVGGFSAWKRWILMSKKRTAGVKKQAFRPAESWSMSFGRSGDYFNSVIGSR